MLQVVSLIKSFDGKPVLKGINLHVKENDILAFVGGNGAGKSTTLNIITGIIEEDNGIIQINGINKSSSVDYKKTIFLYTRYDSSVQPCNCKKLVIIFNANL